MSDYAIQQKLSFLLDVSFNHLPDFYIKFRSYLNIHSSEIAQKCGLMLPKCFTSKNISCPFCFTPWQLKTNSFKLLPSSRKKYKIDDKIKNLKDGDKYLFCKRNKMILKCHVCTRKSIMSFKKPIKENERVSLKTVDSTSQKKKKKRKKDLCANLNVQACLAAGMHGKKMEKTKKKKRKPDKILCNSSAEEQRTSVSIKRDQPVKNNTLMKANNLYAQGKPLKCNGKSLEHEKSNGKFYNNPFPNHQERKCFNKRVKSMKRVLNEGKTVPKSTIKDFLTVVSSSF